MFVGDARFSFCPNLITFAQILPQFCTIYTLMLPKFRLNPTKIAQILPILSIKIFARGCGCILSFCGIGPQGLPIIAYFRDTFRDSSISIGIMLEIIESCLSGAI